MPSIEFREADFKNSLQASYDRGEHIIVIQQFGNCWGYLITDQNRSAVASDWNIKWTAMDAVEYANQAAELV